VIGVVEDYRQVALSASRWVRRVEVIGDGRRLTVTVNVRGPLRMPLRPSVLRRVKAELKEARPLNVTVVVRSGKWKA
jgi:hypothetical protein